MTYDKDSLMPFGKHQGKKLSEVPADYLINCRERIKKLEYGLRNYIDDHMIELIKNANENKNSPYPKK